MKCGLLGNAAGKGRLLDLGRMFANHAKTVYKFPGPIVRCWIALIEPCSCFDSAFPLKA